MLEDSRAAGTPPGKFIFRGKGALNFTSTVSFVKEGE